MADFFQPVFWTLFISLGTLGGIFWMVYLLVTGRKVKLQPGETAKSTGHEWDGIEELNNPLPNWWVWMFYFTIFFGLGYLVLYPGLGVAKGILGWSSTGNHELEVKEAQKKYGPLYAKYASMPIEELAKNEAALRTGNRFFVNNCAVCHGSDARGARGFPNLTDNDWLYGGKPEQIKTTILNGRNGNMPAWLPVIGEDGVKNVASYVLSLSGREAPAEEVAAGKKIFETTCAGCHGMDAKGNQALGAANLTDGIWLYGGNRKAIEQTIAHGRKGVMPAHKELLGEEKAHILAAYVYSMSQKKQ